MINFHKIVTGIRIDRKREIKEWIKLVVDAEAKAIGQIDIIFCSDDYLKKVNVKYLKHKYLTDVITFNYTENTGLSGDLYISIERVRENAEYYHTSFENELKRVIVHGILHLIGYDDNSDLERQFMKEKEDHYLKEYLKITKGRSD